MKVVKHTSFGTAAGSDSLEVSDEVVWGGWGGSYCLMVSMSFMMTTGHLPPLRLVCQDISDGVCVNYTEEKKRCIRRCWCKNKYTIESSLCR